MNKTDKAMANLVGAVAFVLAIFLLTAATSEESINALIEWWNR